MFHSLARNATAAARPVKISGAERVRLSRNANCVPAAPLITAANTENGDAPPISTRIAATMKLATIAASGAATQMLLAASVRGSSRIGFPETVSGHHQPEVTDGHDAARHRRRHATAIHDDDAVGQREQLVEILGDEQDAGAPGAGFQELLMDIADRADVEAARRLVGEDDARIARHLAAEDQLLHVAAREEARRRLR